MNNNPQIEIDGKTHELLNICVGCMNCSLVKYENCLDISDSQCLKDMNLYWRIKKQTHAIPEKENRQ